jgi:glutamate-1-semialdehyde 2,1-aminomutase
MISVHFGEEPVSDFESSAKSASTGKFNKFFHGLLDHGIYIAPSAFETWFITDALSYKDLDATIEAVHQVSKEL